MLQQNTMLAFHDQAITYVFLSSGVVARLVSTKGRYTKRIDHQVLKFNLSGVPRYSGVTAAAIETR